MPNNHYQALVDALKDTGIWHRAYLTDPTNWPLSYPTNVELAKELQPFRIRRAIELPGEFLYFDTDGEFVACVVSGRVIPARK